MRKPEEIATAFASRDALNGRTHFFLVGIGGAGMSALARMVRQRGLHVSGTDSTDSPEVERLRSEGIEVHVGHTGDPIRSLNAEPTHRVAVVLSDAIDLEKSPEVAAARELNLPLFRRSQLLGWLLNDKKVIAVTGTHGKTTTTGMTGSGLMAAGLDPLVVVGANIPDWQGPVHYGQGEYAVVEACEAYDALHDLDPYLVVLTNLELDHVDFHGSYENLRASILRFVDRIPEDGALIYCAEDAGAAEVARLSRAPHIGYTLEEFHERLQGTEAGQRGRHNLLNASAALAVADRLGADVEAATPGVLGFRGAERRQQVLHEADGITVIDDYAHHPTEVASSLQAIREHWLPQGKKGRLIVVFQPHLYSRTAPLIQEFADALSEADFVVLTDIYPAREAPMPGVSSARIAERIEKPVMYIPSRHLLPCKIAKLIRPGDVVVGMGAGNISQFAPGLVTEFERRGAGHPIRATVLYGGDSAEREVSLHSGRAIQAALLRLGYESELLDMTELLLGSGDLKRFVGPQRPDVAVLAVHGTHAEDGAIQGLLELLHVPYTGSGIQASAIAMDKAMTKQVLEANGIRTPRGVHLHEVEAPFDLRPPLIVKPNAQGSTVGLKFIEEGGDLCGALATAFASDDSVLVEEWIKGVEISVPVLDDQALPPVEIAPVSGRYDFESKYTPGATEEIIPARLPDHVLAEAQRIALAAHRALGCAGATRTDMIVRPSGEGAWEIFALEVNTLPGMTPTSLLPNSAAAAGIPFDELCRRLVEDALRRDAAKA